MKIKPIILFLSAFAFQAAIAVLDIQNIDTQSSSEFWRLTREAVFGLSIFLLFFAVSQWFPVKSYSLKENFLTIIRDILLIFGVGFVLNLILPERQVFNAGGQVFLSREARIYNAIITFVVLYTFTEILILLRPFIYHRRDRFTQLQYYLFIILVIITAGLSAFFNLDSPVNFNFSGKTLLPDIALAISIAGIIWLSTRNKWIPFLTKKEKYFYFIGSLFFFTALFFLFEWLDEIPVHSILAASYANLLWLFLFIYTGMATVFLLFHLPTARLLERKLKEISSLQSLTTALTRELDFDRLVVLVTKTVSEVIESHSCMLLLTKEDGSLYMASYQNLTHKQIQEIVTAEGQNLAKKIMGEKVSILLENISGSDKYRFLKKWHPGMESLIAVPLITGKQELFGVLFALKNIRFGFNQDDLSLMEAFANQAVIAIENTRRIRESLDRQRLQQELKIAMEVQQRLLPQKLPESRRLDIYAVNKPASEVGGDYYDILISDTEYLFVVGDVSGKGASAAFYMAELKGAIQANRHLLKHPDKLMIQTNSSIFDSLDKASFITIAMLYIDESRGTLKFARGGHTGLLKIDADGSHEEFEPSGLGIGLVKEPLFGKKLAVHKDKINPGDIYILYTDGISEAMNESRDEYGVERFVNTIKTNRFLKAGELGDKIIEDVRNFAGSTPAHDDITLIIIKIKEKK
jgi:serine phosphatase RsbU (regulator of sigma subunit)